MLRLATKSIDLKGLVKNYDYIKGVCKGARVMAVVKSQAYGHGLTTVAKALSGADGFAVAQVGEAVALRRAGIEQKILVLQGCHTQSEMDRACEYELSLVCHRRDQLEWLKHAKGRGVDVWVKFDTGMHRLGFSPDSHAEVMASVLALPGLREPPVLMSHLACADERDPKHAREQIKILKDLHLHYRNRGLPASLANSAAALRWPDAHCDWVRSGIAVYGCAPPAVDAAHDGALVPVMSLTAPVIAVKELKKGARVGYGGTYVCQQPTRVGVIAAGYGDGYPRHARNGTPVWLGGRRHRLIGRVSMDMITVDLEDAGVDSGDVAELWGKNLPVAEVAACCDSIPYELLCGAGACANALPPQRRTTDEHG